METADKVVRSQTPLLQENGAVLWDGPIFFGEMTERNPIEIFGIIRKVEKGEITD